MLRNQDLFIIIGRFITLLIIRDLLTRFQSSQNIVRGCELTKSFKNRTACGIRHIIR